MISELIDKQDNFEIVRDQIAYILLTEIASQMALATADGQDPNDWELKIYTERSNPWERYLNPKSCSETLSPTVNIWYDNSNFDMKASDVVERQKSDSIFNIDCYGYGRSAGTAGGHSAGDKSAALAVHKAIRLVRNILMSSTYTYLGLPRGTVWLRWPQSITTFQPQIDGRTVQNIVGARISLRVSFSEFSPQYDGEALEYVSVRVIRADDGQVFTEMEGLLEMEALLEMDGDLTYFEAAYDYTT